MPESMEKNMARSKRKLNFLRTGDGKIQADFSYSFLRKTSADTIIIPLKKQSSLKDFLKASDTFWQKLILKTVISTGQMNNFH